VSRTPPQSQTTIVLVNIPTMYAISTMVIISIVEVPTTSIVKDVFSSSGIETTHLPFHWEKVSLFQEL
jgi:hypothetical protein